MESCCERYIELNNGVMMPRLGLGVYQAQDGQQVIDAIKTAVSCGYRSIDTAAAYKNERGVGQGVRECGVERKEIFVTTKLWNDEQGYDKTLRAFDRSMRNLGLDVLDLYLIHWPAPGKGLYVETWKAFEALLAQGRVRTIGVSNFTVAHLKDLLSKCNVPPAINQVECHPYFVQPELEAFMKEYDIALEAWSPLARGGDLLADPVILEIAKAHGKSAAQVVLRWEVQRGLVTIPKSVTPARIRENTYIFDFSLTDEQMSAMEGLNKGVRIGPNPDTFS